MIVRKKDDGLDRDLQKIAIANTVDVAPRSENTLMLVAIVRGGVIGETGTINVTTRIVATVTEKSIVMIAGKEETEAEANHPKERGEIVAEVGL